MVFRYRRINLNGKISLTALSLIVIISMCQSCPPECQCYDAGGLFAAKCTNYQQSTHAQLPKNITTLTLSVSNVISPCEFTLDSVETVSVVNSSLDGLPLGWIFSCYPRIIQLSLGSKNTLKRLNTETFATKVSVSHLSVLQLNDIGIEYIEPGSFIPVKSILTLDIYRNKLTHIEPSAFAGLINLKSLHMQGNSLNAHTMSKDIFRELKSVEHIEMTISNLKYASKESMPYLNNIPGLIGFYLYSRLEDIEEKTLCDIPSLKTLGFRRNRFNNLSLAFINCLPQLNHLDIANSNLKGIILNRTHRKPSLEILELSQNRLSFIPPKLQHVFPSLKELILSRNPLKLKAGDFTSYPCRLTQIHLSKCGIDFIPYRYFDNCKNLKYLNLRNNNIRLIPRLPTFDIYANIRNNPLHCGCQLNILNEYAVRDINTTADLMYTCATPYNMTGEGPSTSWGSMEEDNKRQFKEKVTSLPECSQPRMDMFTYVENGKTFLECHAQGDPPPSLTITGPDGLMRERIPNDPLIYNVTLTHQISQMGNYICRASNSEGQYKSGLAISEGTSDPFTVPDTTTVSTFPTTEQEVTTAHQSTSSLSVNVSSATDVGPSAPPVIRRALLLYPLLATGVFVGTALVAVVVVACVTRKEEEEEEEEVEEEEEEEPEKPVDIFPAFNQIIVVGNTHMQRNRFKEHPMLW